MLYLLLFNYFLRSKRIIGWKIKYKPHIRHNIVIPCREIFFLYLQIIVRIFKCFYNIMYYYYSKIMFILFWNIFRFIYVFKSVKLKCNIYTILKLFKMNLIYRLPYIYWFSRIFWKIDSKKTPEENEFILFRY